MNSLLTVMFLRGLPASGKTTWAKDWVAAAPAERVRVNKDDIRASLKMPWSKGLEKSHVIPKRDEIITLALREGLHVVVDDTNLEMFHYDRICEIAQLFSANVLTRDFFDVPVDECIRRDAARLNSVGEKVIRDMDKRLHYRPSVAPYPVDPSLRSAIICDIDGTLSLFCVNRPCGCHLHHRNPYDASTAHLDTLNVPVASILERFKEDSAILLVSGREGKYRRETEQFLLTHGIHYDFLVMRETGDNRKDSLIKEELFNKHIRGRFNVRFVLDDRNHVVDYWRSLGLSCLQVAEGNF